MANAGIDRSNIGPGGEDRALLLPRDPDASARRISLYLGERTGITPAVVRSEEHTSELQSLMRISYAVFCLKKKTKPLLTTKHITKLVKTTPITMNTSII